MSARQGSFGRQAEEQLVLTALAELIDRYGAEQLQDPGRVRSLLSDQLGAEAVRCRRELNLVVSAAEAKVPAALLNGMPRSLDGLASRLTTQTGLGLPAAYWAVLTWAAPLGYAGRVNPPAPPFVAAETATTPSPRPSPTPQASPASSQPFPRRAALLAGAALTGAAGFGIRGLLSNSGQPNAQPQVTQTPVPETPESFVPLPYVEPVTPTPTAAPTIDYTYRGPSWGNQAADAFFAAGLPPEQVRLGALWQIGYISAKFMIGNALLTHRPPGAERLLNADDATANAFANEVWQGWANSPLGSNDLDRLSQLWDVPAYDAKYLIGVREIAGQAVE